MQTTLHQLSEIANAEHVDLNQKEAWALLKPTSIIWLLKRQLVHILLQSIMCIIN